MQIISLHYNNYLFINLSIDPFMLNILLKYIEKYLLIKDSLIYNSLYKKVTYSISILLCLLKCAQFANQIIIF